MSTEVDLDEAQRLADAATNGPWTIEASGGRDFTGEGWYQVEINFADPTEPGAGLMLGDHENADADAEFIAAARSLVPALVLECRRLRSEVTVIASFSKECLASRAALARVTAVITEMDGYRDAGRSHRWTTLLRAAVGTTPEQEPND